MYSPKVTEGVPPGCKCGLRNTPLHCRPELEMSVLPGHYLAAAYKTPGPAAVFNTFTLDTGDFYIFKSANFACQKVAQAVPSMVTHPNVHSDSCVCACAWFKCCRYITLGNGKMVHSHQANSIWVNVLQHSNSPQCL